MHENERNWAERAVLGKINTVENSQVTGLFHSKKLNLNANFLAPEMLDYLIWQFLVPTFWLIKCLTLKNMD